MPLAEDAAALHEIDAILNVDGIDIVLFDWSVPLGLGGSNRRQVKAGPRGAHQSLLRGGARSRHGTCRPRPASVPAAGNVQHVAADVGRAGRC